MKTTIIEETACTHKTNKYTQKKGLPRSLFCVFSAVNVNQYYFNTLMFLVASGWRRKGGLNFDYFSECPIIAKIYKLMILIYNLSFLK